MESDAPSPPRRKKSSSSSSKKSRKEKEVTEEETSAESGDISKRSMTQCVPRAFSKTAAAPKQDQVNLDYLEYAPRLKFVPPLPALQGETAEVSNTKLGLATYTFRSKDGFDKKGNPQTQYDVAVEPHMFLAASSVRHKPGQHKLAMVSVNTNTQKMVDEFHKKMAENSAALIQHMEVNNYPVASRNLVSESLFFASKNIIGECEVLSPEVCTHVMNHLLRSGKWCSCGNKHDNVGKPKAVVVQPRDIPVAGKRLNQFVFNVDKYPAQSMPSGMSDPKLCYPCVNKLLTMGKLKEGENPPASLWFDGWLKLNEHRVSAD